MLHITPGERAVLRLLAEGQSTSELAASLEVSEPEVEAQLMALFRRMGVETEREAAAEFVKRGLLSDGPLCENASNSCLKPKRLKSLRNAARAQTLVEPSARTSRRFMFNTVSRGFMRWM